MTTQIPDEVRYEIFERFANGTLSMMPMRIPYHRKEDAESQARVWTGDEEVRYLSEARGPVKPKPASTYVVVRMTVKREVI